MHKLRLLILFAASHGAWAQTPATNLMPDGSHDMYAGLGAVSAPIYEGARARRMRLLPVLQIEWSNGVFISGQSVGMHWSSAPALEYGPLLALDPGRTASGTGSSFGNVNVSGSDAIAASVPVSGGGLAPLVKPSEPPPGTTRLTGLDDIPARLLAGGFVNLALGANLRWTNSVLVGAGSGHDGLRWNTDLQSSVAGMPAHHSLSLSGGLTLANHNANQAWFGVSAAEARTSINPAYRANGGLKDVHAGLRWNVALDPGWMVTSNLQLTHLAGGAGGSPLVERANHLSVSSALAYRF
jgi:outer membrane protein